MKYYLFFVLVLLFGCNHNERHGMCQLTDKSTFTTLEKGGDKYIGRKYFLDKNLNFDLIQEQHLVESKNKWLKKNYTVKNGQKILKNQKLDGSLDKEFYGFLN